MEKWKKKAIELISRQLLCEEVASVVPYAPQKTAILPMSQKYFSRTRPSRHGISASRLYAMLCELEGEERANVHSIAVIAGGDMICECAAPGYSVNMPHLSHSMSKTVTGFAVGMLVDEGRLSLDARVCELLPECKPASKRLARLTVDDLLKMSSGVPFAELGTVTSDDWCDSFFSSDAKYEPGTGFSYNSMNTYILSRIVCKITKRSLSEFLDERLFRPLHITNYLWERSADGAEKGGWGLYLSCEDWAKLGLMMLNGGVFEGKRILSQEWVNLSSSIRNVSDGHLGDFDYGYQMWVGKSGSDFLFNGMFGQNVWICPKNNIVVAMMCGNNELFQRSPALAIVRKYLGADMQDTDIRTSYLALKKKQASFFVSRMPILRKPKPRLIYRLGILKERPISTAFAAIEGEYRFPKNNIGLLPLFVRLMQNNLAASLESLCIKCHDRYVSFSFTESGEVHEIRAGIREYFSGEYSFRGERYLISAMCEERTDIHGGTAYRLALIFPELPNTELIEITKTDIGLSLKFSESPDKKIVDGFLETSELSQKSMVAMALLKRVLGEGFVADSLDLLFSPQIAAVDVRQEALAELIAEQNDISSALRDRYRGIIPLIKRFVGDPDEPERPSPLAILGSFFKRRRDQAPEENGSAPQESGPEA